MWSLKKNLVQNRQEIKFVKLDFLKIKYRSIMSKAHSHNILATVLQSRTLSDKYLRHLLCNQPRNASYVKRCLTDYPDSKTYKPKYEILHNSPNPGHLCFILSKKIYQNQCWTIAECSAMTNFGFWQKAVAKP